MSNYRPVMLALAAALILALCGCRVGPSIVYVDKKDVWKMDSGGGQKSMVVANGTRPRWIPGTKDTIAFVRHQAGGKAIYLVDHDGKNERQLTGNDAGENFSWSPDRNWIVYESDKDGNPNIYKIRSDGTGETRLTDNSADDIFPRWSPGGTQIAFMSDRRNGDWDIFLMDPDGKNQTNLTGGYLGGNGADKFPAWSLGGDYLAFQGYRAYHPDIFFVELATKKFTRTTTDTLEQMAAGWDFNTPPNYVLFFHRPKPPTSHSLSLRRYTLATGKIEELAKFPSPCTLTNWEISVTAANVYCGVINPISAPTPVPEIYAIQYHLTGSAQPGPRLLGPGRLPHY